MEEEKKILTEDEDGEELLSGGRVTQGVVRIGDTVHRPMCENSALVHKIFLHLKGKGMTPEFLGIDWRGREVIGYLPGETPDNIGYYRDETLRQAAKLIRALHDALSGFPGVKAGETVCHFDLSPCNFRFREGLPYAVFDWDAARIGDPMDDLAYAAWLWLDLGNEENAPEEANRRVALFLEAYGASEKQRKGFRERILRQMKRVAGCEFPGNPEQTKATRAWAKRCARWVKRNVKEL